MIAAVREWFASSSPRFKLFVGSGLLALVLLLSVRMAGDALRQHENANRREREMRMRNMLDRVISAQDTGFFLGSFFWDLLVDIRTGWDDSYALRAKREDMRIFLDGNLHSFIYQSGRVSQAQPATDSRRLLMGKLIGAVGLSGSRFKQAARDIDPVLRREFGERISLSYLRRRSGEYVPVRTPRGPALLMLDRYAGDRGLGLIIENIHPTLFPGIRFHQSRLARYRRVLAKALPESGVWLPPRGISPREMRSAWEQALRQDMGLVDRGGLAWLFERDRVGRVIGVVVRRSSSGFGEGGDRWLGLLAAALFLFGVSRLKIALEGGESFVSIRVQLRLLFLGVTLLPGISALALGWLYLQDQEDRLRNAAFAEGIHRLQSLEAGYRRTRGDQVRCYQALASVAVGLPANEEAFEKRFADFHSRGLIRYFLAMDGDTRLIYRSFRQDRPDLVPLMEFLARGAIRRWAPDRLPGGGADRVSAKDLWIEQVTANEELGWSLVVDRPETILELKTGLGVAMVWWKVYPGLASGPAFVAALQETEDFVYRYVTMAAESGTGWKDLRVFDNRPFKILPSEIDQNDRRRLEVLLTVAERTNRTQQRQINLQSGLAWVIARPDTLIGRFDLAIVRHAEGELQRLASFRLGMMAGILLALLVAVAAGQLLTGLILVPVADLEQGIEHIRRRRSGVEVPCRREDEFGELARVFNRTLSELKELELARVVQTSLLPSQIPQLPGYSLAAVNLSATDLSGDYYDLLPLPGGELLTVIGDVTGHGASAALAMAMAKATVVYRLADGERLPHPILESLNEVFFRELRSQRKFMTLLAAQFSPTDHTLRMENAGHNYPIFFSAATGQIEQLMMVGLPLGVRRKGNRDSLERVFAPGDAVVFYTDGFTECVMPDESQFGDDAFEKLVVSAMRPGRSAKEILEELLTELHRVRRPGPLNDDITLVILRRNSA